MLPTGQEEQVSVVRHILQEVPSGVAANDGFSLIPMAPRYREHKAAQAAARLIQLSGGAMNHMKLVKLLYFAERQALILWGRPITFDFYVSMPHGPVLSFTLDRINDSAPPDGSSYWHSIISERRDNEVRLACAEPPTDQLSLAELQLIDSTYRDLGHLTQWQLRDRSHALPEWRDPAGSSVPISIRDILLAEGFGEQDVRDVEDALGAEELAERLNER